MGSLYRGHRFPSEILGEIAFRLKRVMEFDPDREIFPKDPEGNKLLTKQYRAPWSLA